MRTNLIILIVLTLAGLQARAQKADTAKAIAHYKFSWVRDTTQRSNPYTENMILLMGRNASVYKSYDRKQQEAMMRKQVEEQVAQIANGASNTIQLKSNGKGVTRNELFLYPAAKKMIRNERLINYYLVEEELPVQQWNITADTMSVGDLHCQKATTHFKGRNYTAWFCPDLPFHTGPWKLNGLPGLIVEAYDDRNEVVFKFDGMEDPALLKKPEPGSDPGSFSIGGTSVRLSGQDGGNNDPRIIEPPVSGIKATPKEFDNLKEAMRKDPRAFAQSAMAASGTGRVVTGVPMPAMKMNVQSAPQSTINNPMELPEEK